MPDPSVAPADFSALALPHLDDVARFARSLTRDAADADDVVQETFLRAWRHWHTFVPGSDPRRWLFTIARNVFLRTKERERPTESLDEPEGESLAAMRAQAAVGPDVLTRALDRADLGPALRAALEALEEPFRSAVVLVDVQDLSYAEASEILGIPIGTVRSRLFRGRRLLQTPLLAHAQDAGFAPAGDAR